MDAASREPEVCGDDATPLGAGVVVVTGARGSGKTTLVNRLVSAFLHDARRAGNAVSSRATETETLTRATPRSAAAARTADERVADEYADMCRTPEGRRAFAAVEAQRGGVLPLTPTTLNVVVRRAPPDAPHAARVTVTYRDEPEIHALVAKARLAHGLTRGPPPSPSSPPRRSGNLHDRPRDHLDSDAEGDSADTSAPSPRPTLAPAEFARLAGVLGCDLTPRAVARALSDRSKPYLPARYRDLLGSTRVITVRAPGLDAAARAVRAVVHRLASPTCARLGCIAGDVLVELPLDLDVVIVDTPGAPTDDRDPEGKFDDDITRASSDEWSVPEAKARLVAALAYAPMDILLGVFDGRPGPSRALRAALIESRAFDAMIRRRDGGSLALAWSLDGPILSSRRAFHTQRDVAAFADEQIEAIETVPSGGGRGRVQRPSNDVVRFVDARRGTQRGGGGGRARESRDFHALRRVGRGRRRTRPSVRAVGGAHRRAGGGGEGKDAPGTVHRAPPRQIQNPPQRPSVRNASPRRSASSRRKSSPKKSAERSRRPMPRRCPTATASPDPRTSRLGTLRLRG